MDKKTKEMYSSLIKELKDFEGGIIDQYVDFETIAKNLGFKIYKTFKNKNYITNNLSGRYEVWVGISGYHDFMEGKGNSLGEAVRNATRSIMSYENFFIESNIV